MVRHPAQLVPLLAEQVEPAAGFEIVVPAEQFEFGSPAGDPAVEHLGGVQILAGKLTHKTGLLIVNKRSILGDQKSGQRSAGGQPALRVGTAAACKIYCIRETGACQGGWATNLEQIFSL